MKENKKLMVETGKEKETWKKVLNFIIEIIRLIVAAFLGGGAASHLTNL